MIKKVIELYSRIMGFIENYLEPILLFYIRFWVAKIFWYSGLTKINSWNSTIYLFKEEYKVPFFSPEIAAYISTAAELACPILLFFGVFTRITAIPLLIITAMIQFTYLDLKEHTYWAFLLFVILIIGPGKISIDYLVKRKNIFKIN